MYNDLLESKIVLLRQFYNNCKIQLEIIRRDKIGKLEDVLIKQDKIMDELKSIDNNIKTNFKEFENKTLLKEIEGILKEIKILQDKTIKEANDLKHDLNEKFKQIKIGKKAIYGGYIKPEPMNSGYYIDKKIGK